MAFILNTTNSNLTVTVQGQFTAARFRLAPNTFQEISITPGNKALIAFDNNDLFYLRAISSSGQPQQTFFIDDSGIGEFPISAISDPEDPTSQLGDATSAGPPITETV